MDETYWTMVVDFMREGIAVSIAKQMAWGELRMQLDEELAEIERRRQNRAA